VIVTKTECDNEFPFPEAVPEQGANVENSLEQASPINNLSTHSALKRETAKQQTEGFVICSGTVKKVDYPYFHAKIDNDSSKDIALPSNAGIPSGSVLWLAFRN